MPESTACLNARVSLEEIRSLKRDFAVAYDLAISSGKQGEIERAQILKRDLETKTGALQETLAIVEAERLFDLRRQYEAQTALLRKAGLIETKRAADVSGVEREVSFMTGIDGKTYTMPSYDTIVSRLAERKEFLETKADQGFKKLLLVPFGMSLDALLAKFKAHLLEHKKAHGTFSLDENQPVWVWESGYNGADANGTLVYDPLSFDGSHAGATKAQVLERQEAEKDTAAGWRVLLLQGGESTQGYKGIPRSGNGQIEGAQHQRPDIEAGKSPREYLADQRTMSGDKDSPYRGESGMTPEEWVVLFMAHLEETGRPIDDYQNNTESIAYLTGAYFATSDDVPYACWYRDGRRAYVSRSDPDDVGEHIGVRSAVRV
ncbi:MAG: hypothetical protein NUV84_03345 [Candidatus Uhrbacteria bacterium]|nr:hypothetical protein [Candidatus Uhrbacteria bacterium]